MKSRKIIFLTVTIFILSALFVYSDQIYIIEASGYQIELTEENFHRIIMQNYYSYAIPGYPDLPSKGFQIAVPPQTDLNSIEISFQEDDKIPIGNYNIRELPPMATWIDGNKILGEKANVYSIDSYYPEKVVELVGTSKLRKWKIVNVRFTPFQYNPVTGNLIYIPKVYVNIKYDDIGGKAPSNAELSDTTMDERVRDMVFNYEEAEGWYSPQDQVTRTQQTHDYVIITTNFIESNSSQLNNFLNYLTGEGYLPLVVTEDDYGTLTGQSPNGTAEKIRQWLINNYLTLGIEYVLLIGNPDPSGDIPMKMCWPRYGEATYRESPTDYFYADLTGNWDLDGDGNFGEYSGDRGTGGVDFLNEVYVGRIPVYSGITQLDSVLSKIISYGNEANITWRNSAMLPMSYSDATSDGAYLGEAMKTNYLTPASYSSWTLYMQGSLCTDANSSFVSNEELVTGATRTRWMGNSYGMVWWWGHGSQTSASLGYSGCGWGTILNSGDTSSLNDSYPSFVYQCSCSNGYPENSNNLGTALLYNGAIATISASRVSWYAVTSWNTGLKYYCDNASLGYYYGNELVTNNKKAAKALYDVKSDMGLNGAWWGDESWMNLFDFNLYGNPVTSLSDQASTHTVTSPNTPTGPSAGAPGISLPYSTSGSVCSLGHSVEYRFDWGDGSFSPWSSSTSVSKSWSSLGAFIVKAQARCSVDTGVVSSWSSGTTVNISNTSVTISGIVRKDGGQGVGGVTITFSNGGGMATTNSSGDYTNIVGLGWSGTATPSLGEYVFYPANRTYSVVSTNLTNEDYDISTLNMFATVKGVLAADVDNDSRDELVVDFGSLGIWLYDALGSPKWVLLYGENPDFMIAADHDNDNRMEIFAYFDSQNAIHRWDWVMGDPNGQWSWNWVSETKCDYMRAADIEADGEEEIVLGLKTIDSSSFSMQVEDYNSGSRIRKPIHINRTYGAWAVSFGAIDDEIVAYRQSMHWWDYVTSDPDWTDNWTSMTTADPDVGDTLVANFDADAEEELVVDILNQLWAYNYSSGTKWSRLNAATVLDIRAWPQVSGTDDELVVSFLSPNGLWMYDAQSSPKWQSLNGLTPDYDGGYVEVFNADGDTDLDIAVDYSNQGIGLWKYDYNGSPKWTSMNGNAADYMVRADLDGDGDHELLVKFSSISGIWKWNDDTTPKWQRINGANPNK